jgi:pimeloyl-ACP methyl ester carboxylesterase
MQLLMTQPRKESRRFALGLLLTASLFLTGCSLFLPYWMPTAIVYAPNFGKTIDALSEATSEQLEAWGIAQSLQVSAGPPLARLSVWVMEPEQRPARGTVLVLHGIRDSKMSMRGMGRLLAGGGYRCLLVDLRGHGSSGGDWLTYGVVDSRDLSQVLDAIQHRGLLAEPVGAFGCSYGAATAIQLAGRDSRIQSVVAVAPFATLNVAVHSYARLLGLGFILPKGMIDRAVEDAGRIGQFRPAEASPLQAIRQTSARILLIHGAADWKIPPSSSQQLHAAAPQHSRLILVENAGHDSVMATVRNSSKAEILAWFDNSSQD